MSLNRISLQNAANRLGYTDPRSAESWCESQEINIYIDRRRKFVMEQDLDMALEIEYISSLKKKYPDNFEELYKACKNQDYLKIHELTTNEKCRTVSSSYLPESDSAINFFNSLNI